MHFCFNCLKMRLFLVYHGPKYDLDSCWEGAAIPLRQITLFSL